MTYSQPVFPNGKKHKKYKTCCDEKKKAKKTLVEDSVF